MEKDALDDVERLPTLLKRRFYIGLRLLAHKPTLRSRPSGLPHLMGQLYEFSAEYDEMRCYFSVWFKYGADELTLFILRVSLETM